MRAVRDEPPVVPTPVGVEGRGNVGEHKVDHGRGLDSAPASWPPPPRITGNGYVDDRSNPNDRTPAQTGDDSAIVVDAELLPSPARRPSGDEEVGVAGSSFHPAFCPDAGLEPVCDGQ